MSDWFWDLCEWIIVSIQITCSHSTKREQVIFCSRLLAIMRAHSEQCIRDPRVTNTMPCNRWGVGDTEGNRDRILYNETSIL